ncbi:MAG: hypothetical protein WAM14_04245, partial [Candidatus Nitrosopolaris sp.]
MTRLTAMATERIRFTTTMMIMVMVMEIIFTTTVMEMAYILLPFFLKHSFVSNKVIGPDRFRFINYYWTTSNTPRGVNVGTSANTTFLGAQAQPPNVKEEVDTNEGQNTLA